MVPIVNQPVMEHIVGLLLHHGITDIVATLAFMPQVIADYFGDGEEWGVELRYAIEETPLGTAGSVKNAENLLGVDKPFIVISGDALTDIDLRAVLEFHSSHSGPVTIALKRMPDPLDFGVVITDSSGRIERFLEKPTWGQVFSDQVNTGIYVIDPWVLDFIPSDRPFDFSSDLFPALMKDGHDLYGVVVDGYWCDVGNAESYVQAHVDVLSGAAKVFIPGLHPHEGLWIAETANIDDSVVLGDKVVIGNNCTIRAGAHIGDLSVIGDNCVVDRDARVTHTIMWDDTFIGSQASVSGAVLCRRVDIRAGATVDSGVVIGSDSAIGARARIGSNVQIFPYKTVESGATLTKSLIWESTGPRSLFDDSLISGLIGIDITPELGLRVAEAFASLLPKGGHVVVTRDTSKGARMIKRAICAGLNASGINVRDLRVASPAVSRFTTQKTRCVGGIHVAVSEDNNQSIEIRFFDRQGLDIAPWEQRRIERLYFRGEFRRAFFEEIGEIIYPPRPLEYYSVALNEAIAELGQEGGWRTVVADFNGGTASLVLPLVARDWRINLIALNAVVDFEATVPVTGSSSLDSDQLTSGIHVFGADIGAIFDKGGERISFVTPACRRLDGNTSLHLMVELWCRTHRDVSGAIAVPIHSSRAVETIAAVYGREVVRPGLSRRALAQAIVEHKAVFAGGATGGYIFGNFFPAYDGVLTLGMVARMTAQCKMSLDQLADMLPPFHLSAASVNCPASMKGLVMRAVVEAAEPLNADLTEGVRIHYPDGWALVVPDSREPAVKIWTEASSDEAANARSLEWSELVKAVVGTP
jgi:mannose-1-phosphate guanylyltransferase/phosphomannomutase